MLSIPTSVDEITSDWLAAATGLPITSAVATQIGQGIGVSSAVYRVACEGQGCPSSLVVKLPALDPAAVFTSTMLRMYIREVRFFDELASASPIRVPKAYAAAVDEESSAFVVVMEDMGGMRFVDQNEGMDLADAEQSVSELAAWHATWWRKAEPLAERGTVVSLADPIYPAVLPMVFAEGWEKLTSDFGEIPAAIHRVAPGWTAAMPGMLTQLAEAPATLAHGDYRADNILFSDDGRVALLDFQLTGVGSGVYDLAYFVTQSLAPELAAASERALFDRYVAALVESGVPEADVAGLWDNYRTAALFCLVYPVVACRGMDLDDARQRALIENMFERFERAVDDLSLADLLG
ncbi:MAG: phosphotransferase [Acidimicrobiales bacterium]